MNESIRDRITREQIAEEKAKKEKDTSNKMLLEALEQKLLTVTEKGSAFQIMRMIRDLTGKLPGENK